MPSVKVRDNEPFDFALRRFKRACEKAGVLAESRKRQYYEKPTQERKRKKAAAVKRLQRRVAKEGIPRRMYWSTQLILSNQPTIQAKTQDRICRWKRK